jgi:hypothetical protein
VPHPFVKRNAVDRYRTGPDNVEGEQLRGELTIVFDRQHSTKC